LNDARASVRAALVEFDALTITSMLPGIDAHYLDTLCGTECYSPQLVTYYVKFAPHSCAGNPYFKGILP
jgi:hypothetical protein